MKIWSSTSNFNRKSEVALQNYCTEIHAGDAGGTASLHTGEIAAEDKHLVGLEQLVGKEYLTDIPHVHFHSTKGILNTIRNRTMFRWERRGLYWFLFFVWHIGIISPKTMAYRCLSWSIVLTPSACGNWILWKCRLESLVDRGINCFFIAWPNYISRRETYVARRETYIPRRATYISRRGIYFR